MIIDGRSYSMVLRQWRALRVVIMRDYGILSFLDSISSMNFE
jgi:hypothetical protein